MAGMLDGLDAGIFSCGIVLRHVGDGVEGIWESSH